MNFPTFIIGMLVFAAFTAVIVRGIRNRKKGKGGCSCGDCSSCGICHYGKDNHG